MKISVPKFKLELEEPFIIEFEKDDLKLFADLFFAGTGLATTPRPPLPTTLLRPESSVMSLPPYLTKEDLLFFANKAPLSDLQAVINDLVNVLKKRTEAEKVE